MSKPMPIDLIDDFLRLRRQKHPRRKREIKTASVELHKLLDALGDADMDFPSTLHAEQWRRFLEERTAEYKPARKKRVRRIHRQYFEYMAGVLDLGEPARSVYSFLYRLRRVPDKAPVAPPAPAAADPLLLELRHVQMLLSEQSEMLERTAAGVQDMQDGVHELKAGASTALADDFIDPQDLFPALDELQAALDWRSSADQADANGLMSRALSRWRREPDRHAEMEWQRGVGLIRDRLLGLLERKGVFPFGQKGEVFDPGRHVAVAVQRQTSVQVPVITRVIRCGYRRDGVVLRYAEVEVTAGES